PLRLAFARTGGAERQPSDAARDARRVLKRHASLEAGRARFAPRRVRVETAASFRLGPGGRRRERAPATPAPHPIRRPGRRRLPVDSRQATRRRTAGARLAIALRQTSRRRQRMGTGPVWTLAQL